MSYERSVCTDEGKNVETLNSAPTGLVAYYTFDDSAAVDSSGRGNHAKVAPPNGPGHGPTGFGATFDGSRMMQARCSPPASGGPSGCRKDVRSCVTTGAAHYGL